MANTSVLEEVKKFIPYAVHNSVRSEDRKKNQSADWVREFENELIKMYMDGVKKRKTDKALCEYAKLISKANQVELPDSIKYFLVLLHLQ